MELLVITMIIIDVNFNLVDDDDFQISGDVQLHKLGPCGGGW